MKTFDIVEKALSDYPQTRSDDRKLIMTVWWLQNSDYDKDFRNFFQHKAIMPETITRARRKIQESGKYLATKAVEEERFNKFRDMHYTSAAQQTINQLF